MRPRISKQGRACHPEGVPSTKGRFDIAVRFEVLLHKKKLKILISKNRVKYFGIAVTNQ
ncbi:8136_t:CDS:2, partial [Funneliformis geosporum]